MPPDHETGAPATVESLMSGSLAEPEGNLAALALLSLVVGAGTGLIAAYFRIALDQANALRDRLIDWGHGQWSYGQSWTGFAAVVGACAVATAVAAMLVRRLVPQASGSGIPHVEAVLHGAAPPAPYLLVPVKFVGGILAIGAGLALGREGPSVQMGAGVATLIGRLFRRGFPDLRVLIAAGAGAGLATTFNAPLAGAIFVLEELVGAFEPRIAVAALGASIAAITVARQILGNIPDFLTEPFDYPSLQVQALFLLFGLVVGAVAVVYNMAILGLLSLGDRLGRIPVELRAGVVGAVVGTLAWFDPGLVGGGDTITGPALLGDLAMATVPMAFAIRFVIGPLSYAALTPGGLFAPLLALGAQAGLMFAFACQYALPGYDIRPEAFAMVGIAVFFTGSVRAPVTGMILATEMTANTSLLMPMIGASFTAMLVPTLLRNLPIYEARGKRAARQMDAATVRDAA